MRISTLLSLATAGALLLSPAVFAQGQRLRFEVPSGQTTSGKTSTGGKPTLAVTVGGHGTTTTSVPKGSTSKQVVDALIKALTTKGYKVTRDGNNGFFVDEGPGNKPILKGGGIGGTDTGITSVDAELIPDRAPPGAKQNGGQVPKPKGKTKGAKASKKGSIQVDAIVQKIVNGKPTLVNVQVQVPIEIGDTEDDIERRAKQRLQQSGHQPRDVQVPSNLDGRTLIPCFGLDLMQNGDPILGLQLQMQLPPEFFMPQELFVGVTPPFGLTNEGLGQFPRQPVLYGSDPYLGQPWNVFVDVGPRPVFGALFVSPQPAMIPTPGFGQNSFWLIDPLAQIPLPFPPALNGQLGLQIPLPPEPKLAGANLMMQALVLDPQPTQFATTHRLVVRPMQAQR